MTDEDCVEILRKIELILDGIDRTESDDDPGWWETSEGAAFGVDRLRLIRELFKN